MKEKEIEWIINWIYKNPKLVKINNRQKKANIKNYLYSIDMSLSDFKKLVIINNSIPSNKRTTNYFNNKLSDIFVQPFTDSLTCFVVSPIKLVVEESGRIYCTDYNQVKCYLDEYNYIWSCDKNNLIETIDLSNEPDNQRVTVVHPGRGNPKSVNGLFPSVDWNGLLKSWKKFTRGIMYIDTDNPYGLPDKQDCQDNQDMLFTDIDFDIINSIIGGDDK